MCHGLFIGQIFVSTLTVHSLEVGVTDDLVKIFHCRNLRSHQRPEPKSCSSSSARPDAMSCVPSSLLWFEQPLLLYDLPLQLLLSNYIQQIFLLFKSGESPVVGA